MTNELKLLELEVKLNELLDVYPCLLDSYNYIKKKHEGQYRMGGLPYYTHPLEVAFILYKKGLSLNTIKLGFYHDIFEDTDGTEEEIISLSNAKVLNGVHKLTKVKPLDMIDYLYSMDEEERNAKLADRLHNLESALIAPISFRLKYINETEKYYVDFSKETIFEEDIKEALDKLKSSV